MIFKKKQDAAVQQTAVGETKPVAKGGKAAADASAPADELDTPISETDVP